MRYFAPLIIQSIFKGRMNCNHFSLHLKNLFNCIRNRLLLKKKQLLFSISQRFFFLVCDFQQRWFTNASNPSSGLWCAISQTQKIIITSWRINQFGGLFQCVSLNISYGTCIEKRYCTRIVIFHQSRWVHRCKSSLWSSFVCEKYSNIATCNVKCIQSTHHQVISIQFSIRSLPSAQSVSTDVQWKKKPTNRLEWY